MNFIIYNPISHLFDFFIDAFIYQLNNRNISTIHIDKIEVDYNEYSNIHYEKDIVLFIVNPHFIYDYIEINKNIKKLSNDFKYKILYLTEPINFMIEKKIYQDLIHFIKPYVLWTYTYDNFNKIKTPLKIFRIQPMNPYPFIHTKDIDIDHLKKKISDKIVFIGNINENRRDICNMFKPYLININNKWSKEDWTNILSNNLFYLNIHRRLNCKSFESFRIIPILSNGGVIFSERCNEKEEKLFKDFNIIFVERKDIYHTFLNYIKNIDYSMIFEKIILFKNSKSEDLDNLDKYIEYHSSLDKL